MKKIYILLLLSLLIFINSQDEKNIIIKMIIIKKMKIKKNQIMKKNLFENI